MKNENREIEKTRELSRIVVLSSTSQIQIVRLIEVQAELPINPQFNCSLEEASGLQTGTFMLLWFLVLLAEILMFWRVQKKG